MIITDTDKPSLGDPITAFTVGEVVQTCDQYMPFVGILVDLLTDSGNRYVPSSVYIVDLRHNDVSPIGAGWLKGRRFIKRDASVLLK